jgi:putative ATP-dependent endonuclease of OLD family
MTVKQMGSASLGGGPFSFTIVAGRITLAKATAAKTSGDAEISLSSAKVKRLVIRNFRCIGEHPVEIDLDDIVVLVGPNNAGKSTILRAYEVVMMHGSAEGRLKIEDFPNEQVNPNHLPEIELQTYLFDDFPAEHWLHTDPETDAKYVRERWRWASPGVDPKRQGHRAAHSDWDEQVPWGAPGIAKSRRPIPHRVEAFASPEDQGEKIVKLLHDILISRTKQTTDDKSSAIEKMTAEIKKLQLQVIEDSKDDIAGIESSLSAYISEIFVGFSVKLDTRNEEVTDKAFSFFNTKPMLRMGPADGHMAPLDKQGSGARRTLLWSALKIASERQPTAPKKAGKGKPNEDADAPVDAAISRPHVLLLDEPEICLHPNAIREACRVLYDLALADSGWQVMVTTHAPAFIDITRDNTTIVRVDRMPGGSINGTTVFRPTRVKLDEKDKDLLKLLNLWDPHVAEFFFGGQTIVVEGDTEYSVFKEIMEENLATYRNVHIVRARGKYIIRSLIKILNHFGSRYSILHDSDKPKLAVGKTNSAWGANQQILDAINLSPHVKDIRLAAFIPNLEDAVFGAGVATDKPYNAVHSMRDNPAHKQKIREVLDYLTFRSDTAPQGLFPWNNIDSLEQEVLKLAT